MRPKTFEVLASLVEHAGAVLSQEAILKSVWKDVHVGADVVLKSISEIRQALDDKTKPPAYLETIYCRGVRFLAPVRVTVATPQKTAEESVFVGRAAEMAKLAALADEASAGARRAVVLIGPAGIGKTRLLQQASAVMASQGAWVLRARADNAARHSAFWIWSQLIRDLAARVSPIELASLVGSAARDIALVIPSLQDILPDLGAPPALGPELARARFFDGIAGFLSRLGQQRPLVLALDDLHKESHSSLAALQSVMIDQRIQRLLILASARDDEVAGNGALTDLLDTWSRNRELTELTVPALGATELDELIHRSSRLSLKPHVRDRIAGDSRGNPYFAVEILRWLTESEAIGGDGDITDYRIPASVHRVVQERLDHCRAETRAVLRIAAVIGPSFNARICATIAGLSDARLFAAVAEALEADLIVELPGSDDQLGFRHDLVRLFEIVRPYERQWILVYFAAGLFGSVDRILGRLAARLGDDRAADAYFSRTIETCERELAVTELVRAKLDYATALMERSSPEPKRAAELRAAALSLAEKSELPALLARARRASREKDTYRSPAHLRRPSSHPAAP